MHGVRVISGDRFNLAKKGQNMAIRSRFIMAAAAASLAIASTGCTTDPVTGERRISKAALGVGAGAALGAGLGAIIGGKKDRTETIVGAGIGALAGGAIGAYMDQQEKKLREQTAGTGIEVERQGDEIQLNMPSGLTFDVNQAIIKPQFRPTLDQVAQTLTQYEKTFVDVKGHTDSTGTDAYNQTLSQRRAESVASYLTSRGVQRARIATQGFGESQPVASNDTEAGRAENRRVEIRLVPITQQDTQQVSMR